MDEEHPPQKTKGNTDSPKSPWSTVFNRHAHFDETINEEIKQHPFSDSLGTGLNRIEIKSNKENEK
jgi:hypothetical protein